MKWRVDDLLQRMSIREKAGQLFLEEFQGYYKPTKEIKKIILNGDIGGIIYFTGSNVRDAEQLSKLTYELQQTSKRSKYGIPLIISIDHEGGQLNSLLGGTNHPGNMAISATKNKIENAKIAGKITGEELYAAGITVNFAPVIDVAYDTEEPIVDNRSFGSNPDIVSRLAVEFFKAHESAGVAACAKHFPGQRIIPSGKDTHFELDVIPYSKKRLNSVEFKPFKKVCQEGISSIMVGHCAYTAYDLETVPASLSKNLLTNLLRNQWHYDGLVITDDLIMQAIMKMYSKKEAIIRAINSGADLIIITGETREAAEIVEKAVKKNKISIDRLNEACERVLKFKQKWARVDFDVKKVKVFVAKKVNLKRAQKMSDEAITLIRDADNLLPLKLNKKDKLLIVHPGFHRLVPSDQTNFYKPDVLKIAYQYFSDVTESIIGQQPTFSEIDSTLDLTVWSTYVLFMSINAMFNPSQVTLLKKIITFKPGKVITVALRSPTDIFAYPFVPTHLITYGHNNEHINSLFKVLTGKIKATGKIPLEFNKKYKNILTQKKIKRLKPLTETPRI